MRHISYEKIRGLVDSDSRLELSVEVADNTTIDKDRFIIVKALVEIIPKRDLVAVNVVDILHLVVKHNNTDVITNKNFEVRLDSSIAIEFSEKIPIHNTQIETHFIEVELTSANNLVDIATVNDSITIEPDTQSKASIFLNYFSRGKVHNFSYYASESTDEVYLKVNNNSWRKIYEGFSIKDEDLEGAVNYFQLYMKDSSGQKVYSNVVRVVKVEFSE